MARFATSGQTTAAAAGTEAVPEAVGERPLDLLVAGGLIAGAALLALTYFAYHGWYLSDIDRDWAYLGVSLPFCALVGGLYVFAYGWERRDVGKALRLTIILAVLSLLALAAALIVIALKKGGGAIAGRTASTATGGSGLPPLLPSLGSMLGDALEGEKQDPGDDDDDFAPDEPHTFTIRCRSCGVRFAPAPPDAVCPYCGQAALPG